MWRGECGSGVRQNLNPFNGDKSPSARDPLRRAGRQFVRVYPTHPDISTSRPGVARVANHPPTFLTSLTHLFFLHSVLPFFDFSLSLSHFFLLFFPSIFSFYSLIYLLSSSFHSSFCSSYFTCLSSFSLFIISYILPCILYVYLVSFPFFFFYVNSTLSHLSYRSLAKL